MRTPSRDTSEGKRGIGRRQFLKLLGVGAAGAAAGMTGANRLLGASGHHRTPTGHQTADINFDTTINAGDHVSPGDTIDSFLDQYLQSGNLIEFPPGRYRITRRHSLDGLNRFGIRGTGSGPRDVSFHPPSGAYLKGAIRGSFDQGLFENFSIDNLDDDKSLLSANFRPNKRATFRDIELIGRGPRERDDSTYKFGIQVTDKSGVAVVENFKAGLDKRSVEVPYGSGVICMYGGPGHQGELILRNPHIHNQNGSPFRYTNIPGVVTVEGGSFVNNQNMCFRFCGGWHPTKNSTAKGVYIKLDKDMIATSEAIRLDASSSGGYGAEFHNCHIHMTELGGRGCITAPSFGEHGSATFKECVIRNETDAPMVRASGFSGNRPSETAIVFEDCHFTGRGDFVAQDRPDSILRNCCIDLKNPSFNGFQTENISRSGCKTPKEPENIEYSSGTSSSPRNAGKPCQ